MISKAVPKDQKQDDGDGNDNTQPRSKQLNDKNSRGTYHLTMHLEHFVSYVNTVQNGEARDTHCQAHAERGPSSKVNNSIGRFWTPRSLWNRLTPQTF